MQSHVDARGLSCPQPVILTRKALEAGGPVTAVVDNETAVENISRLAQGMGYDVEVEQHGNDYHIHIEKSAGRPDQEKYNQGVILVTGQYMGRGDDALGKVLMKSFLYTLTQMKDTVTTIIFINSGVTLTSQGSEVLDHLLELEQAGVEILSCGTCLDFYQLKNKLLVGQVTNMYSIVERVAAADKVITV
ncbi:MAG: sulfurtransferase-like selenium metabolism protein YedF [Syntrophomonadaceae bacterium]|jgi:selenium metabolism protein YedF|nr:sulfurtransferase-like selenium metabolism protein YedF [Syntrophomonadaceae bacterium]